MNRGFTNVLMVILLLIWYDEYTPMENILLLLTRILMIAFGYFCFMWFLGRKNSNMEKNDTEF